jgi:predicted DNA-binding protein
MKLKKFKNKRMEKVMALLLSPETYARLEKRFGKEEAKEIVEVLGTSVQAVEKQAQDALQNIQQKADFSITQKKFELKDELTKELATKADVVRLEGVVKADVVRLEGEIKAHVERLEGELKTLRQEVQTIVTRLDRKFTIMFLILLFTVIFLNQNSLEFIAKLLGLIKP